MVFPSSRLHQPSDTNKSAAISLPRLDFLAIGDLYLDILYGTVSNAPHPGEETFSRTVSLQAGGIATFAITAAKLGARSGIHACCGDGSASSLVLEQLSAADVDTNRVHQLVNADLQVTSAYSYNGDRTLITGGAPLQRDKPVPHVIGEVDDIALHLRVEDMPWLSSTEASVFADVGWDPHQTWDAAILRHLEHCHAFLPNDVEAMAYTRARTPLEAAKKLADYVPLSIVTCGVEGVVAVDSRVGAEHVISPPSLSVTETTGAGDTFLAVVAVLLRRGVSFECALEAGCFIATARSAGIWGHAVSPTWKQAYELALTINPGLAEVLEHFAPPPAATETESART